jgi:hypothetical protein
MDKYSIVIPTLWKSNRTKKLLVDLQECEYVDEIIVIDNSYDGYQDTKVEKIRFVSFGGNIYVNPAWNKGIELARNNQIALLNDDINFNPNIFEVITEDILNQFGIIGMGEGNYKSLNIEGDPILEIWQPGINDWGWGCFIMFNRKNWIDIPDNIKIWYGDRILFNHNSKIGVISLDNVKITLSETIKSNNDFSKITETERINSKTFFKKKL